MEQFLESTKQPGRGPYYGGSFEFGNNEPHCYPGKIPEGVPFHDSFRAGLCGVHWEHGTERFGFGLAIVVHQRTAAVAVSDT